MNDEVIKSEESLPEYRFDRVPEIFPEILGKFRRESEGVNRRMGRVWTKRTEQEKMNESKKRISTGFVNCYAKYIWNPFSYFFLFFFTKYVLCFILFFEKHNRFFLTKYELNMNILTAKKYKNSYLIHVLLKNRKKIKKFIYYYKFFC